LVYTSTPDPVTLTGSAVSEWIYEFGRGSRDVKDTYTNTGATHWKSTPFYDGTIDSDFVSKSESATSSTWTYQGTYLDEDEVEQEWTFTVEVAFTNQYSQDDFLSDAVALFNECAEKTNDYVKMYDEDGASYTTNLGLEYPFGAHFDDQTDIPNCPGPSHDVAGTSYYYDSSYDANFPTFATPWVTLVIAAVRYDAVRIQPALYTRESSYDGARGDVASLLLPPGTLNHWVIPSPDELTAISSGTFKRMSVSTIAAYTDPAPDYPVPT
jgi:hypothetical protein